MAKKIRWDGSFGGFVTSKDGRYRISPLYCGTTRPQFYQATRSKPHCVITSMAATQAEAKEAVQDFEDRKEKL